MTTYADRRRAVYTAALDAANTYYRDTQDLAGYQERARTARESWHTDIYIHYRDDVTEYAYLAARAEGGRVYADLATGERVSVPSVAALYAVSDTTGAPAEPLIARMIGDFIVSHATIANLVSRA